MHDRPAGRRRRERGRLRDGGPPRARAVRPETPRRASRSSTTSSTASPATAACRRGSRPRRPRWPATQKLGNLILIYDDNRISIEGDTKIAFTEDVAGPLRGLRLAHPARRLHQRLHHATSEKVGELYAAIEAAKAVTDKPSFIKVTTIIGWPLPTKAGSHSVHGAEARRRRGRGAEDRARLRPGQVLRRGGRGARAHPRQRRRPRRGGHAPTGTPAFEAWRPANPEQAALLDRVLARRAARGPRRGAAGVPGRARWRRARRPARCSPRWPTSCPSCGAARPTSPARTTRR